MTAIGQFDALQDRLKLKSKRFGSNEAANASSSSSSDRVVREMICQGLGEEEVP